MSVSCDTETLAGLAIVVVNYGPPDLLHRGLAASDFGSALVVVVDNLSTAFAREAVAALCEERGWTGVFPDANTGFGTGCNLGAATAIKRGARQLLFLNPDASIDRRSVERLVAAVNGDPDLLAAPTLVTSSGSVWSAGSELNLQTGDVRSFPHRAATSDVPTMSWASGACLLIGTGLWQRAGGFDHQYFLYWEDVDLCARVLAAGGRIAVVQGATATHDAGQTHTPTGARAKSGLYYYYNIRNRELFAAKWLARPQQRRWQRHSLRSAYRILMRGGRRQLIHPVEPVLAVVRGLRDGHRDARSIRRTDGARRAPTPRRPIRVLESVDEIRPTTNPYIVQLVHALGERPDTRVQLFSFRRAILGGYDVLHVHWPGVTIGGRTALGRLARRLLATLLMLRLSLTRTPIVRTWHNLDRPPGHSRWDHAIFDAIDRRTRLAIRLNEETQVPLAVPTATILHGHYRDWFEPYVSPTTRRPRRILYFGIIKPYQGVEQLLELTEQHPDADLELRLVGNPADRELADRIRAVSASDPRVTGDLRYADDEALAGEVLASALVVLPYRHMHNSGAVLLALSLGTPVLVPDNEVTRRLAAEVGPGWVHTFEGSLTMHDVEGTLSRLEADPPLLPPDLDARGWDESARLHAEAFVAACHRGRNSGAISAAFAPTSAHETRTGSPAQEAQ